LLGIGQDDGVGSLHDVDPATNPSWFSVRCIFRCDDDSPNSYEERITVWRAASFEEAIGLAEAEASDYAELVGYRYLGLAQAYQMAEELGHGAEVYSLMRDSDLPPDVYLSTFFDTGEEHQSSVGGQR